MGLNATYAVFRNGLPFLRYSRTGDMSMIEAAINEVLVGSRE